MGAVLARNLLNVNHTGQVTDDHTDPMPSNVHRCSSARENILWETARGSGAAISNLEPWIDSGLA